MKIYDGHAHVGSEEEIRIREQHDITTFLCGTNPVTSQQVIKYCHRSKYLLPVYGLHPWYAGQYSVEDMMPFISEGVLLGEIGMDSVWCKVPLDIQEGVFREQLMLATELRMPVVLHTKGQEKRVLQCIETCTVPILVHWYTEAAYLDAYADRDCYFTVGPDVRINQAVQEVVKRASIHRLLVESDGFEAVRWALGSRMVLAQLPAVLADAMLFIAQIKQMELSQVEQAMGDNFNRLKSYHAERRGI